MHKLQLLMDIPTLLNSYWGFIAGFVLAGWTVYLHIRSNKSEKKKNIQTAYIDLTSIINEFRVDCLKHFLIEDEVMKLKLEISEDIDQAKEMLKYINISKKAEVENFLIVASKLKEDFESAIDPTLKEKIRQEIRTKIIEADALIKDFQEASLKNQPFLEKATEIQNIAANRLTVFNDTMPQRVISLSTVVTNLIKKLNASSAWQLIASKSILKIISDLESSCLKLNTMILASISSQIKEADVQKVIKSEEFEKTWKLCEEAINKMRSEIL